MLCIEVDLLTVRGRRMNPAAAPRRFTTRVKTHPGFSINEIIITAWRRLHGHPLLTDLLLYRTLSVIRMFRARYLSKLRVNEFQRVPLIAHHCPKSSAQSLDVICSL